MPDSGIVGARSPAPAAPVEPAAPPPPPDTSALYSMPDPYRMSPPMIPASSTIAAAAVANLAVENRRRLGPRGPFGAAPRIASDLAATRRSPWTVFRYPIDVSIVPSPARPA